MPLYHASEASSSSNAEESPEPRLVVLPRKGPAESARQDAAADQQSKYTDLANAGRLVELHGAKIRYCRSMDCWFIHDGLRWKHDTTRTIERLARDVVSAMRAEARQEADLKQRERTLQWANQSAHILRFRAMIDLARSEPGIAVSADQLDSNPWLLNTINGPVDLQTATLRQHSPDDLLTRTCSAPYDGSAQLSAWDDFIHEIMAGDQSRKELLQRAAGYSLLGTNPDGIIFNLYGPLGCCRIFMQSLRAAVGSYARCAADSTFLAKYQNAGPHNDLARLAGARLVTAMHGKSRRLCESLLTILAGCDPLPVRYLNAEFFEMRPEFKLWFLSEDPITILPRSFIHIALSGAPDPTLMDLLRSPQARKAVLAWAVRGCLEYQRSGLQVPQVVVEPDVMLDFISNCFSLDPEIAAPSAVLYDSFRTFWRSRCVKPVPSATALWQRLRELKFKRGQKGKTRTRIWRGLQIPQQFL